MYYYPAVAQQQPNITQQLENYIKEQGVQIKSINENIGNLSNQLNGLQKQLIQLETPKTEETPKIEEQTVNQPEPVDNVNDNVNGNKGARTFKDVALSISNDFLPNISKDLIMYLILKNTSPEFIRQFNSSMADPKFRAEVDEAVINVKELVTQLLEAAGKPINDAFNNIADNVIPGLVGKLANTASTAVFNIATAIPGVGAVLSAGKVLNNISESVANVSGSFNNASQILSNAVDQMKEKLEVLKLQSTSTNDRINESMQKFDNPLNTQQQNIQKGKIPPDTWLGLTRKYASDVATKNLNEFIDNRTSLKSIAKDFEKGSEWLQAKTDSAKRKFENLKGKTKKNFKDATDYVKGKFNFTRKNPPTPTTTPVGGNMKSIKIYRNMKPRKTYRNIETQKTNHRKSRKHTLP
jgi:chaperonin cofactor prefoldin